MGERYHKTRGNHRLRSPTVVAATDPRSYGYHNHNVGSQHLEEEKIPPVETMVKMTVDATKNLTPKTYALPRGGGWQNSSQNEQAAEVSPSEPAKHRASSGQPSRLRQDAMEVPV